MAKHPNKHSSPARRPAKKEQKGGRISLPFLPLPLIFFLLVWLWAAWWMGDVGRVARERSFFTTDTTLMHFLLQQSAGWLWLVGRAMLTLFRWPWLGGLVVAVLLTLVSLGTGYCLRLPNRWRWVQFLPAAAWMGWVAWCGMELYYQHESGRALGILALATVVVLALGLVVLMVTHRPLPSIVRHPKDETHEQNLLQLVVIIMVMALPVVTTSLRHPYLRPVTRMEVQMLGQDWQGMAETARQNADLSYRPLAAYYAIALARTNRLSDDLFQIRLDYDTLYVHNRSDKGDNGTSYYQTDCNYHSGLLRVAEHNAMELLTMDGPSLYALKHLARLAILHSDYSLARKYLDIIALEPFESNFVQKYAAMLPPDPTVELVAADTEFASILECEPISDCFESQFQQPAFLGYFAVVLEGRSMKVLQQSLMANLYSKRMPDFLMRCQPLVGQPLPQSIAEGLLTQMHKEPQIANAFPSLQMEAQRYGMFLQSVQPYMKDRPAYAHQLFKDYQGYYPYYYFFGNLKATRKREDTKSASNAGVN